MSAKEYSWRSSDGHNLYAIEWQTSKKPEAVVAFVHGHGDHCRRYDKWFSTMAESGIAVVTFDYRGHGRSEGKRGVIDHFADLFSDISLLMNQTEERYPGIPKILYGHSMGAILAFSWLLKASQKPALAIITSPWLELSKPHSKLITLGIILASTFIPGTTFSTGLHSSDFSAKTNNSIEREKDEYLHNRISARLLLEIGKEKKWIMDRFNDIKTPLLLMQGSDDAIMNINTTRRLSLSLPSLIDYREWENAGHQLQFSERSDEVLHMIIKWIKKRI